MASESEHETRTLRREIDEAIVMAREAQSQYQAAAARGSPPQRTVENLREAAIRLHNVLKGWKDNDQVAETWEEFGIDTFGQLLKEQNPTAQSNHSALSRPPDRDTALAVGQLGAGELNHVIDGLLKVAQQLGFAPAVDEPTTQTEITDEMLEEVEKWRQQNLS